MDADFGNEFNNLNSITDVENKGTLKVISSSVMGSSPHAPTPPPPRPQDGSSSLSSAYSFDTDILSSPGYASSSESTSSRSSGWPVFKVPRFTYDAELQLSRANAEFKEKGTLLDPPVKLRSSILDGLTEEIVKFKVYLSDEEFNNVAEALVKAHPCLQDPDFTFGRQ